MKKILFILLCLSLSTLYSQSEKKYDVNSSDLPDWVNLMYANKVDEGKVIKAYELYYEKNEFVKNKNSIISEALKKIKEGDVIEDAIVKATTDWGIFLDIRGIDALLHVSDLSHGRVKRPADLVTIGQTIKVKIIKIDEKTNRVSASLKALTEDPFENVEKKYKVGEIYEGIVTKIMDYGCFVRIEEGIEGLIHSSELDWKNKNAVPSKLLSVSQKIKFKIVSIDSETKRISLSYKATQENPWENVKSKIGEKVKIKINNILILNPYLQENYT